MDDLIYKYKNDLLTEQELQELRRMVNTSSDKQLEDVLKNSWLEDTPNVTAQDVDVRMKQTKSAIDSIVKSKRPAFSVRMRFFQMAAAILLPIFILSSLWLFWKNAQLETGEILVSTGLNERAEITLPDGSRVALNANSKIYYSPKNYNRGKRKIRFEGEGYFQVHKNQDSPFIINTTDVQVTVLGTTFNLSVYPTDETAELSLEEGCVSLLSLKKQENVVLHPNEKAVVNRETGEIVVSRPKYIQNSAAWRNGELIFRNSALQDVIRQIEKAYNVKFQIESPSCMDMHFTGTLPLTSLNELLEILELSLDVKLTIQDKTILFEKNEYRHSLK